VVVDNLRRKIYILSNLICQWRVPVWSASEDYTKCLVCMHRIGSNLLRPAVVPRGAPVGFCDAACCGPLADRSAPGDKCLFSHEAWFPCSVFLHFSKRFLDALCGDSWSPDFRHHCRLQNGPPMHHRCPKTLWRRSAGEAPCSVPLIVKESVFDASITAVSTEAHSARSAAGTKRRFPGLG
jgi:hypothetical protein